MTHIQWSTSFMELLDHLRLSIIGRRLFSQSDCITKYNSMLSNNAISDCIRISGQPANSIDYVSDINLVVYLFFSLASRLPVYGLAAFFSSCTL